MPPQQLANWKGQSRPIIVDIDAVATGSSNDIRTSARAILPAQRSSNAYLTEKQQNEATAEIRGARAEGEEMTNPYPNMRHRDILQKLMQAEWTPHQRLAPAGDGILGTMLGKGWIERRVADRGIVSYRITDLGKEAFRAPMPLR